MGKGGKGSGSEKAKEKKLGVYREERQRTASVRYFTCIETEI
jgi:hypothetical protein